MLDRSVKLSSKNDVQFFSKFFYPLVPYLFFIKLLKPGKSDNTIEEIIKRNCTRIRNAESQRKCTEKKQKQNQNSTGKSKENGIKLKII